MTEEMSGGLRHHSDAASGPELCGWIQQSSKKDRYCLEPTSASALRASYATKLQKQSSIYLDIADVVRGVENRRLLGGSVSTWQVHRFSFSNRLATEVGINRGSKLG